MMILDPTEFFMSYAKRKTPKKLREVCPIEKVATKTATGFRGNPYRNVKGGPRIDLDATNWRSGYEANMARLLVSYNIPYIYEGKRFQYPVKQRRTSSYLPDFRIGNTKNYNWLEIKGWCDTRSATLLKRFRRYYPEEFEKLVIVIRKSKSNINYCEALNIPYVIFWDDVIKAFAHQINNWE